MDSVSASSEVIQLISTTLVFIRSVTKEGKIPSRNSRNLGESLTFLDAFSSVCFCNVTGLLRDARVHPALVRDVERSLYSLNKSIAAQREAWRYVSVASDQEQKDIEDLTSPLLEGKYERKKWTDGIRERSQIWREKARPGLYETLFGQEEMDTLVSICGKWIYRLRQTLEIILLNVGPPSTVFSKSQMAIDLGVAETLERQLRANTAHFSTYNALPGKLRDTANSGQLANGITKTLYKDGSDEADVMVEVKTDKEIPTESLYHLTWVLQAPTQTNHPGRAYGYYLNTLDCMGFIDDPINKRSLILYRSPQSHPWSSSPPSIHALIMKGPTSKLGLTTRFRTARALAATILETHASGWVHGNVCARSVLMLPQDLNDPEPSPFLVGWTVPKPSETSTLDLEPSLYQHQDRFGKPACEYSSFHDIYSLGVVLLELGLWRTMSTMFARRLQQTPQFSAVQQHSVYLAINKLLMEYAGGIDLKREMGERYAAVVSTCLTWHNRDPIESIIEFRQRVVDALSAGAML